MGFARNRMLVRALIHIIVVLTMSAAGVVLRVKFAHTNTQLLLDISAIMAENNLLLSIGSSLVYRTKRATAWCYRPLLALALLLLLCASVFTFASADYLYQSLTGGVHPTTWVVAAGLQEARSQWEVQVTTQYSALLFNMAVVAGSYILGIAVFIMADLSAPSTPQEPLGVCYAYKMTRASNGGCRPLLLWRTLSAKPHGGLLNISILIALWFLGGRAPVSNAFICIVSSMVLSPPSPFVTILNRTILSRALNGSGTGRPPNVILVVHESLSGTLMECAHGRRQSPFYHGAMANISGVVQFTNARTVAGITEIATPAILTGLLGYTDECMDRVYRTSLASEFNARGYDTSIFSSYRTDWSGTRWAALGGMLNYDFDTHVDPSAGPRKDLVFLNGYDDRKTVKLFGDWLQGQRKHGKPFFSVLVLNNAHYPHLVDKDYAGTTNEERYFASIKTVDESLEQLFSSVRQAGVLRNTIMFGAGDHGDTPGTQYSRTRTLTAAVLNVVMWAHVPAQHYHLVAQNRERVVSTIDIVPTLRELLGDAAYTDEERGACVVGQSLLQHVPHGRIAESWQEFRSMTSISIAKTPVDNFPVGALSTADAALVYDARQPPLSFVFEFRTDEEQPVQHVFNTPILGLGVEQRAAWVHAVMRLNSSMVKTMMPQLLAMLNKTVMVAS